MSKKIIKKFNIKVKDETLITEICEEKNFHKKTVNVRNGKIKNIMAHYFIHSPSFFLHSLHQFSLNYSLILPLHPPLHAFLLPLIHSPSIFSCIPPLFFHVFPLFIPTLHYFMYSPSILSFIPPSIISCIPPPFFHPLPDHPFIHSPSILSFFYLFPFISSSILHSMNST